MATIGKRIAKYREAIGYSQQMLSEKSSVPQSAISEIESGKRRNPGYQAVQNIAQALGVTVNDLLEEQQDIQS